MIDAWANDLFAHDSDNLERGYDMYNQLEVNNQAVVNKVMHCPRVNQCWDVVILHMAMKFEGSLTLLSTNT